MLIDGLSFPFFSCFAKELISILFLLNRGVSDSGRITKAGCTSSKTLVCSMFDNYCIITCKKMSLSLCLYLMKKDISGEFVRANGLQEGDFIVIYSDIKYGKYVRKNDNSLTFLFQLFLESKFFDRWLLMTIFCYWSKPFGFLVFQSIKCDGLS